MAFQSTSADELDYYDLNVKLEWLCIDDKGDSEEADKLRDQMETYWYKLLGADRCREIAAIAIQDVAAARGSDY